MIYPLFILVFFLSSLAPLSSEQPYNYPTANLSTLWINEFHTKNYSASFSDDSTLRLILLRAIAQEDASSLSQSAYACGFYCNGTCDSYLLVISIINIYEDILPRFGGIPQLVWSANRNDPVRENATMELTAEGDLVLRDADGTTAWSTNTAGKGVAGLNLTETGNLVLFDAKNNVVWQSFDHPTDCLLPGQILAFGKNLTADSSPINRTAGLISLSVTEQGLVASIQSDPPQVYYPKFFFQESNKNRTPRYARFYNGSLEVYNASTSVTPNRLFQYISQVKSLQYVKLGHDGHLRLFEEDDNGEWREVADMFNIGKCDYPMVCGMHGICSSDGQCSCPESSSRFRQVKERKPELGCSEVKPISCNATDAHSFLDLVDISYFSFIPHISNIDINSCREACLKNCSCKAAIMRYSHVTSDCCLLSEIFSLKNEDEQQYYSYSVSLKVQGDNPRKTSSLRAILGSSLGAFCAAAVIGIASFLLLRRRRRFEQVEEEFLDHVPGMPTRFSFEELAIATKSFSLKLGEGGFGSVFEGLMKDGTKIAVKRLNGVGHIKKSFLAEVETIGSIHHINLVRLIGFCAEKTHRLLIYEFMCNGSLEKWIFNRSHDDVCLNWNSRRKIILDIAKGLVYLHEECRQKILHLDIKPQNILLDEHFNAKLADFGLSKLVDRDQSRVVTTMRGTPGYLAPEWLSAVITEKVDVYSFGVVVLEILCGRKTFEESRPEEERYLLPLFKEKARKGQWQDLVDKRCEDVESNAAEVGEMVQISAWCMQSDHWRRPSMSMVIKALEGGVSVERYIDYDFLMPQYLINEAPAEGSAKGATPILPSVLSGPR